MKTKLLLCLGLAALALTGCVVQCIHPLFAEKDYIQFPALAGAWTQQDGDKEIGVWTFEENGRKYRFTHTDENGRKGTFNVAAGKIAGNIFLESWLDDSFPDDLLNDFATAHLVGTHIFAKAIKTNDALYLVAMNTDWLEKHLAQNPKALTHVKRDKMPPLVTASTEELQKFVAMFGNDTNAFQNELKLVPKKSAK